VGVRHGRCAVSGRVVFGYPTRDRHFAPVPEANVGGYPETRYVMTRASRMSCKTGELHTFTCTQCGQDAATIELVDASLPIDLGPGPTGEVMTISLNGPEPRWRLDWLGVASGEATPDIASLLEGTEIDPLVLAAHDWQLGAFCCRRCTQNYCSPCWRKWPVFDSDGSGWFEGTRGICPEGHEQALED